MWNAGSVKYVELQDVWSMWNCWKCEVCGTERSVNYVGLQEV